MGGARPQQLDGVAAFLFREPDRRSEKREQSLQTGPYLDHERGRRQKLQRNWERRARRFPRRVGES